MGRTPYKESGHKKYKRWTRYIYPKSCPPYVHLFKNIYLYKVDIIISIYNNVLTLNIISMSTMSTLSTQ